MSSTGHANAARKRRRLRRASKYSANLERQAHLDGGDRGRSHDGIVARGFSSDNS
jgi:hypothetical protein